MTVKKSFMFITISGAVAVGNLETLNVQPQVKTYV